MKRNNHIYSFLIAFIFMMWLLIPFVLDFIIGVPFTIISEEVNSKPVSRPVFDVNNLDAYPQQFDNYFTDRFPYREDITGWWLEKLDPSKIRKRHSVNGVDEGRDGWLFDNTERKVYEGTDTLSADQIELLHRNIRDRVLFYAHFGIKLYIFFPPLRSEIYPGNLPEDYIRHADSTDCQRITSVLLRDTLIPFIDVKPAVLKAGRGNRVYSVTGNQWNTKGAYEAYYQVISRIKKDFPVIRPVEFKDVSFRSYRLPGGDLAQKLGTEKDVYEVHYLAEIADKRARDGKKAGYIAPSWSGPQGDYEHVTVVADNSLPKIFVIRDPYFKQMVPFFAENFSKMVYLSDACLYELHWDLIEKEKPDIVLLEVYEPEIKHLIQLK